MSKRNSQANKAAARERLRAERERQAKKDKVTPAGRSSPARSSRVLAIAGGIGYAVVQATSPRHWEAAEGREASSRRPTPRATNGTTVVIGKARAKKTLELYEDSRCPVCASFEQTVGATVKKDVDAGKYKIQYIGATFIDNDRSAARARRTR